MPGGLSQLTNPILLITPGNNPFLTLPESTEISGAARKREEDTQELTCDYTHRIFTAAKKWGQPKGPSASEQRTKLRSSHTTEYHSAIKRDEVLRRATTWMSLRNRIPGKRSQTPGVTYWMIPPAQNVQSRKIARDRK